MKEFFQTYQDYLLYFLIVIVIVAALCIATVLMARWLQKKRGSKKSTTISLIRNILNTLWVVLGVTALSFIIARQEEYKLLLQNFRLILYLGILAVVTVGSAAIVNNWLKNEIEAKTQNNEDPTSHKFFRSVAIVAIHFLGIILGLLAFPSMREVAKMALGGAGVIALLAGIASKEALENMVGGLFIILFKPFKVGDFIKLSDTMEGNVTDITLRHTVLRNFENKKIIIPNAIINKEKLVSYDLDGLNGCRFIEIGIAHDSDVDIAKKILQEECEKHPLTIDNRSQHDKENAEPVVKTAIADITESAVIIRAWVWAQNFDNLLSIQFQILETVKKRYQQEGVKMSSHYITVINKEKK